MVLLGLHLLIWGLGFRAAWQLSGGWEALRNFCRGRAKESGHSTAGCTQLMGRNLHLCLWIPFAKEAELDAWQGYRQAERSPCLAARQEGRNHIPESCSIRLLQCTAISLYTKQWPFIWPFVAPSSILALGVNKKASCKVSASNGLLGYSPLQLFQVYTDPEATDLTLDTQAVLASASVEVTSKQIPF